MCLNNNYQGADIAASPSHAEANNAKRSLVFTSRLFMAGEILWKVAAKNKFSGFWQLCTTVGDDYGRRCKERDCITNDERIIRQAAYVSADRRLETGNTIILGFTPI